MIKDDFLEFSKQLEKKDTIFYLAYNSNNISIYGPYSLFVLDTEDIQYLKNKYLPKVNDQFQEELKLLQQKFKKDE